MERPSRPALMRSQLSAAQENPLATGLRARTGSVAAPSVLTGCTRQKCRHRRQSAAEPGFCPSLPQKPAVPPHPGGSLRRLRGGGNAPQGTSAMPARGPPSRTSGARPPSPDARALALPPPQGGSAPSCRCTLERTRQRSHVSQTRGTAPPALLLPLTALPSSPQGRAQGQPAGRSVTPSHPRGYPAPILHRPARAQGTGR